MSHREEGLPFLPSHCLDRPHSGEMSPILIWIAGVPTACAAVPASCFHGCVEGTNDLPNALNMQTVAASGSSFLRFSASRPWCIISSPIPPHGYKSTVAESSPAWWTCSVRHYSPNAAGNTSFGCLLWKRTSIMSIASYRPRFVGRYKDRETPQGLCVLQALENGSRSSKT